MSNQHSISFSLSTHKCSPPHQNHSVRERSIYRGKIMKLVWSADRASSAYICTVKSCENCRESGVAEFISAMAAGWDAKLIVESWSRGGPIATSIGLAAAAHQTGGRHVCIVPDERSRVEYLKLLQGARVAENTEVVVGEAEEVVAGLDGVEFLVVDCRKRDFARVLRHAKLGEKGAVLVCKNAWERSISGFRWQEVIGKGARLVRSVFLPVGKGLDIAHIGSAGGGDGFGGSKRGGRSRWIKHVDKKSGEEHVFRA